MPASEDRAQRQGARSLGGLRRLLPLLFLALGLGATFLFWRGFVGERRAQFRASMATAAEVGHRSAQTQVESQLATLQQMAALWTRVEDQPRAAWRTEAELVMHRLPGVVRLAWIDSSDGAVWVASGSELARLRRVTPGERAEMRDLLDAARQSTTPRMEGPFPRGDGYAYRVFVPALGDAGAHGVLAATLDVEATLDPVFAGQATRYALAVSWNGVEIFRRGKAAEVELPWWEGARSRLALSWGPAWELDYRPSPALHQAILTPLPNYLLYMGLFASFLLAALVYEMHLARRRARILDGSYRELDARLDELREAHQALRELNQRLEERVAERTAELHEAIRDLESFNDSVSHDLRSPLGAIQNLTAILQEDCQAALGEAELELLDRVQASASAALEMMDGLVEISRMGRTELRRRPTDMATLAREAFEEASAAAESSADLELAALPRSEVDPALMRLVWMNLMRNAVKYSRGREKPRVQVGFREEQGSTVYFVRDNGVGFDMRFVGKLFRVFERLHSRDEFEGTGVGLALVERIVRRHGGQVWAEGEPDRGACFFFRLPRSRAAASGFPASRGREEPMA